MANDDATPPGNGADESAEEVYTREQVQELIQERDRRWQRQMTPLHQERADLRREIAKLEGRMSTFEKIAQTRAEAPDDLEDDGVDWNKLADGDDFRAAVDKRFQYLERRKAKVREPAAEREERLSPTEERMEMFLLEQEAAKVRSAYEGMTEEEMRQIYDLGARTGIGNLAYLAHELYGSPEAWKTGSRAGSDSPRRGESRSSQSVLAGRARAQAQARTRGNTIEVPGGQEGYRAVDKIAEDFLRGRGHT